MSIALVKELRERTGLGMMECKKALRAADNDVEKAIEELRKSSGMKAAKKAGRTAADGVVAVRNAEDGSYALVLEVNSETDFVARTDDFKNLAKELAVQVAGANPSYVSPENIEPAELKKEEDIIREQLKDSGKPENIIDNIIKGKLNKFYEETCLLNQKYLKDDSMTIADLVKSVSGKTGENISINRFIRFSVGD